MLQVVERSEGRGRKGDVLQLGCGQEIEEEMAQAMDLKIFRLEQVRYSQRPDDGTDEELIKELAEKVQEWKAQGSKDNSLVTIDLEDSCASSCPSLHDSDLD